MTNDELNEKIRQACTHAAPDVLDAVLSDCNEQKGRVILMTTENKKKTWAVRMAGLAAGLCLILYPNTFSSLEVDWESGIIRSIIR